MGFIEYVEGLEENSSPQPFTYLVMKNIYNIIKSSTEDIFTTEQAETKTLESEQIDLLL